MKTNAKYTAIYMTTECFQKHRESKHFLIKERVGFIK